jgi:hypothetical protein
MISLYAPIHIEATQTLTPPQIAKGRKGSAEKTMSALAVTADLFVSITNFVGELILIYRCWLLWSRNYWVIILPSLFSIASLGKDLMTIEAIWCSPTTLWCQYVLAQQLLLCYTQTRIRRLLPLP